METISLSKRGYTVLKRWVEVKFDSNLERAKEAQDDSAGEIDTHRFGKNAFKLHRLPTPRPGQILGLVGINGIGKSTALMILGNKLKPNLGNYK